MLGGKWYEIMIDGFLSASAWHQHQNYINSSSYPAFFCPIMLCNISCSQFWTGALQSLNPHKLHSGVARTYMRRMTRRGRGWDSLKPHNLSELGNPVRQFGGFLFQILPPHLPTWCQTSPIYLSLLVHSFSSNWLNVRVTKNTDEYRHEIQVQIAPW